MPIAPNPERHIENPNNPEQIKSENQRRLKILFEELTSSLKAEDDGDTLVFNATPQTTQLFDSYGNKFNATLRLRGDVRRRHSWHQVVVDLDGKDIDDRIAVRIYTISLPSDGALLFESSLNVFEDYRLLGIGSAILKSEEILQLGLGKIINKVKPFDRIRRKIVDASDTGWTSRRFDQEPGWKKHSVVDKRGGEHNTYDNMIEPHQARHPGIIKSLVQKIKRRA